MKKSKEVARYTLGIRVIGGGKACPSAHLIYEVRMSDGSIRVERGDSLQVMPGFEHINGTTAEKKKAAKHLRTDLYEVINALAILIDPVERACFAQDEDKRK